jgi:diguanylate cyclase (GGDEF)-like protein/PAS domain S-box-containing protein
MGGRYKATSKYKFFSGIRLKTMLTMLPIILLALIALMVISYYNSESLLNQQIQGKMNAQLNGTIQEIEKQLTVHNTLVQSLAKIIEADGTSLDPQQIESLLKKVVTASDVTFGTGVWYEPYKYRKDQKYFGPYVYKDQGKLVYTEDYATPQYDYPNQAWYKLGKDTNEKSVWTDPYYDPTTNVTMITVDAPFYDSKGNFQGEVTGDLNFITLQKLINGIHLKEGGSLYLLNKQGTYLVNPNPQKIMRTKITDDPNPSLKAAAQNMLSKGSGQFTYTGNNHEQRRVYYASVPEFGWILAADVPENNLLAPLHALLYRMLIVIAFAIIIASIAILLYSRFIYSLYHEILDSEEQLRHQLDEINIKSHELQINEDRLKRAQDLAKVGNWEINLETQEIWASEEAFRLYGLERKTATLPLAEAQKVVHPEDRAVMDRALHELLTHGEKYNIEFRIVTGDYHEIRYIHSVAELEYDQQGKAVRVLGVLQDISERVQYVRALEAKHEELGTVHEELVATEEELRQQYDELQENQHKIWEITHHDALTGLPNRIHWQNRLTAALEEAKDNDLKIAIIFIDLDEFEHINATLGYTNGDALLLLICQRIKAILRDSDLLARFDGDEFLILMEKIATYSEISLYLKRIVSIFEQPYAIHELKIHITASIGVTVYPEGGISAEELLQNADTARYRAKVNGRNRTEFFNWHMKQELLRKTEMERKLRFAIQNHELILYYQPQFEMRTNRLRGFEALIRWNQAELGFLSPLEFIPLAEETGLIIPIGKWVLETACKTGRLLSEKYGKTILMSVNISSIQIQQDDFEDTIWQAIRSSGFNPSQLELEITESIFIHNFERTVAVLQRLHSAGFKIALDDFGTGYSSLSYLMKLPINTLKIDKSFIQDIDAEIPKKNLTPYIISLVHSLNIETIAEGIENQYQLDYLNQAGCDSLQGYYLGKPVPEEGLDIFFE